VTDLADSMILDDRFGRATTRHLAPASRINVRISDWIPKSVVFLGQRTMVGPSEVLHLGGTAFVVSVPWKNEDIDARHLYLVTARHSVLELGGREHEIRVNAHGGHWRCVAVPGDCQWWYPAESSDVAVRPFSVGEASDLELTPIPIDIFLRDEDIWEHYIGQGDEVAVTGLFTRYPGESRNIPIVRRGSLALMPEEKIRATIGRAVEKIDGYLIEVRSTGGLSGSPAFVRAPIGVHYDVHTRSGRFRRVKAHIQGDYFLLGLVHGHWEIPPGEMNKVDFRFARKGEESINLGIAIVVPAKQILESINHPELVAMREQAESKGAEAGEATTPD
jgi:hypothetical protein